MNTEFDVIVVGSGAGGGVIASELAMSQRKVLLLEAGTHRTSKDFKRWEVKSTLDLYYPIRLAPLPGGDSLVYVSGKCVGGSTTINTKVALRADDRDLAKWHPASGLTNAQGEPFTIAELDPYYTRVESLLGVRERSDWQPCIYDVEKGFKALGAEIHPVTSYTDAKCQSYGSCMQGCPTDGGKSTMNTYIDKALTDGPLQLRTGAQVEKVLVEDTPQGRRAVGVEYLDASGQRHTVRARYVVVAAGALNSALLLLRSGMTNPSIGRNIGLHPLRVVYGRFDKVQDAHRVYPITSHCMNFQHDEDGGFLIEASMMTDPVMFATTLLDENGPVWGERLTEALRSYRHWNGLAVMINDENNASVSIDADGNPKYEVDFQPIEHERFDASLRFSKQALEAAGATQVYWTSIFSTHTQGGCRMGDDPARSAVDRNCESHEVKGLFVGDASLIPRTLSVNPSMTVMALATRLSMHLETLLSEDRAAA